MSRHRSLLYTALILTATLGILHVFAMKYSLYWVYWWFDWVMHFLAGTAGGFSAYWILFVSGLWRRNSDKILLPILSVVFCLLVVGVAWEIMEYTHGITESQEGYALDTIHDLVMDTLGALIAATISVKTTFKKKEENATIFNG
ncbi:hypothetical protein KW807_00610 [Candidatus Parcubacteria bacterium]|nr:hypothetical protein [Candidatus Parcubacteria bacterium]